MKNWACLFQYEKHSVQLQDPLKPNQSLVKSLQTPGRGKKLGQDHGKAGDSASSLSDNDIFSELKKKEFTMYAANLLINNMTSLGYTNQLSLP